MMEGVWCPNVQSNLSTSWPSQSCVELTKFPTDSFTDDILHRYMLWHHICSLLSFQVPNGWSELGFASWMCLAHWGMEQEKKQDCTRLVWPWDLCKRDSPSPYMSMQWELCLEIKTFSNCLDDIDPVYVCEPSINETHVLSSWLYPVELPPAGQHLLQRHCGICFRQSHCQHACLKSGCSHPVVYKEASPSAKRLQ